MFQDATAVSICILHGSLCMCNHVSIIAYIYFSRYILHSEINVLCLHIICKGRNQENAFIFGLVVSTTSFKAHTSIFQLLVDFIDLNSTDPVVSDSAWNRLLKDGSY